ncbi:MAG TPA: tripartite tricarboxylate transporter substrate binding protein [Thermodesulfobacteriota bacterium]|nr:tripartite tricarboxylate transporter substrate binding protein [Thermodesulfobacteriota bacterium]
MSRFVLRVGFVLGFVWVLFVPGLVTTLHAQPYPNRPIQLVIPTTPGAGVDIVGRLVAEELGKILRTPIVPVNKPGASFTTGTDAVVRSKKDGYTLLYTPSTAIIYSRIPNPEAVPYDPVKDLEPLGVHAWNPMILVVKEDSPWKTFPEFVDYARKNPGKASMSLFGALAIERFNMEIIKSLTDTQFNLIPFKGPSEALGAILGGHVESSFIGVGLAFPHVKEGKIRALLTTRKWSELPEVPTATELGYKKELDSGWFAFYAPAGVPDEVKTVLIPAFEKIARNPEMKARIDKMGFVVDYKSPAEHRRIMIEGFETAMSIAQKIGAQR